MVLRGSLLFKICKVAIYQGVICMSQILPEHRVRGMGGTGECAKRGHQGDPGKTQRTDLLHPGLLQNTTLADYRSLFLFFFKTMKILGVKGYVKSQTTSVCFR